MGAIQARIDRARARVMPLEEFTPEHREHIASLVAQPKPPPPTIGGRMALFEMPSRAWYEWYWQRGLDPEGRREKISNRVRRAVLRRDGLVCGMCGSQVADYDIHLDHIKPWSHGGRNTVDNLRVTHSLCNMRRGNRVEK